MALGPTGSGPWIPGLKIEVRIECKIRLGTYNVLLDAFSSENQPPSFIVKVGLGLTAGTIGAICGTPADVALVRMCVDNRLPESQRRNYKRPGFPGIDVRPVSDHTIRP